VKNSRQEIIK